MSDYNIDNAKNDIQNLQDQNSFDFQEIKRLDGLIKDYDKRVTQAINFNNLINKKIESDYANIKKIILDENASATLDKKIDDKYNSNKNLIDEIIVDNKNNFLEINNKITVVRERMDTNVCELNNKINEVATTGTTMETVENKVSEMAQNGLINFNTVTPNMTTFLKESRNLIDESKFSKGVYINPVDGTITTNDTYKTTDYITLEENKNYIFSNNINNVIRSITYYGVEKNFLVGGENITTFNSGTTYKYCRLSIIATATKSQLEIGTLSTEYMPYKEFNSRIPILAENIINKVKDSQLDITAISSNLIDNNTITKNKYLDVTGNISDNTTYQVTDFIEIEKLTDYIYSDESNNFIRAVCFYDNSKQFLVGLEKVYSFNTKEQYGNIKYCRLSLYNSVTNVQLEKGIVSTEYMKKGEKTIKYNIDAKYITNLEEVIQPLIPDVGNPLWGKKVIGFGDSIMYGHGYSGGFLKIIADRNNMTLVNKGVSGATVANHKGIVCIMRTLELHQGDLDADYVILEGGTNDALDQFAGDVGEITEGYNAELDYNTYCKSFEKMLKIAVERWAGKKILYVCVHNMNSRNNLKKFMDLAKQMCRKWSVPYVDLFEEGGMLSQLESIRQLYTSNGDGTHPNEEGYRKYYCDKIEAKMKQI